MGEITETIKNKQGASMADVIVWSSLTFGVITGIYSLVNQKWFQELADKIL